MRFLELRIPPPLVALVTAGAMWAGVRPGPFPPEPAVGLSGIAVVLAAAGLAVIAAGIVSFRRAQTTINPLKPESSTALVSDGIYRLTRNPMYLGMALLLGAWAVWLGSVSALLGPAAFVIYITRFQILPEERALQALFGEAFAAYRRKVRRWL